MINICWLMTSLPLFTIDDLENALQWILKLRKEYSHNSDIWNLRRDWENLKHSFLAQLNDGSYQFSLLNRYEIDGAFISLWSSQDMIALKLITKTLEQQMTDHIPKACYHVKGHGGLKKAVHHTYAALPEYEYVMRSDIKSYYDSISFGILIEIIESYVHHPILLTLISKACRRTETRGGIFYDYHEKGIPMGSPLSPLLGAIALIPLDEAMGQISGIFYARFMDDWVVLTKSKSALRKIVKITHDVVNDLKLQLHPLKTYIGKINHGFNFLAYYMDHQKILPSKETIRRFHERATALYEQSQATQKPSRRYKKNCSDRDISLYKTNEVAPTDAFFKNALASLYSLASKLPDTIAKLRRYVGQWARWLKLGLSSIKEFETCVQKLLPGVSSCWTPGASVLLLG
jgi:hypothetical protein